MIYLLVIYWCTFFVYFLWNYRLCMALKLLHGLKIFSYHSFTQRWVQLQTLLIAVCMYRIQSKRNGFIFKGRRLHISVRHIIVIKVDSSTYCWSITPRLQRFVINVLSVEVTPQKLKRASFYLLTIILTINDFYEFVIFSYFLN